MFKKRNRIGKAKTRTGTTVPDAQKCKEQRQAQEEAQNKKKNDEIDSDEEEIEKRRKRRKIVSNLTFSSKESEMSVNKEIKDAALFSEKSHKNIMPVGKSDQGATVDIIRNEKNEKSLIEKSKNTNNDSDNQLYQGLKNYEKANIHKNAKPIPKFRGIGPQKASDNVKITCRFDYQPDICKDWKETGYCGYGDSCKFLHDRTDYKFGWQLENDWKKAQEISEKQKRGDLKPNENGESDYEIHDSSEDELYDSNDKDGLPFACYICRNPFQTPVQTLCKHYFCQSCIIKSYQKTPACPICGDNTQGTFAAATRIERKQRMKQQQEKEGQQVVAT